MGLSKERWADLKDVDRSPERFENRRRFLKRKKQLNKSNRSRSPKRKIKSRHSLFRHKNSPCSGCGKPAIWNRLICVGCKQRMDDAH